jgi:hypothetical protein
LSKMVIHALKQVHKRSRAAVGGSDPKKTANIAHP